MDFEGSNMSNTVPYFNTFSENKPIITDIDFNAYDIENLLNKVPDKESTSPDNISYRLLKKCHTSISQTISELFRISLDSSKLPKI